MITNAERRFIEQWREQKSGPRWKYYVIFTVGWTVVSFLVIFFILKLFTNLWETGGPNLIYLMIGAGLIIGFFSTHVTYVKNEKKYHAIFQRENRSKH